MNSFRNAPRMFRNVLCRRVDGAQLNTVASLARAEKPPLLKPILTELCCFFAAENRFNMEML